MSAEDIIAGLKQAIERAHEKGIEIFGATLTPFEGTTFTGYFHARERSESEKPSTHGSVRARRSMA